MTGLAAVVGPMLGGWLVTADLWGTSWRSIFLINLRVGVLLLLATLRWVPESRSPHPLRLDLLGVAMSAAAVFLLVFPLVQGRELGWPAWLIGMLVVSVPALAVFVRFERQLERRGGSPVVPMSLFTRRGFIGGVVVTKAFNAGVGGFFLVLALYLQGALGFTAWEAGLVLVPFSVGAMVASGVAVPLAAKAGRLVILAGGAVIAGAMLLARVEATEAGSALGTFGLLVPMVLAGLGLGLVVVPLVDVTLAGVNVRDAGAASGVLNTTRQLGPGLRRRCGRCGLLRRPRRRPGVGPACRARLRQQCVAFRRPVRAQLPRVVPVAAAGSRVRANGRIRRCRSGDCNDRIRVSRTFRGVYTF